MEKELEKKISDVKAKIMANSKDARFADKLIADFVSLQRQKDVEAVELVVPVSEVTGERDLGSIRLVKTHRGFLFEAKGGMSTFVHLRMTSLYEALDALYGLLGKESHTEEEDAFINAFLYILQTPIFCSLDQSVLYGVAANILSLFNEYASSVMDSMPKPEAKEDIEKNIAWERDNAAVSQIAASQVPPTE